MKNILFSILFSQNQTASGHEWLLKPTTSNSWRLGLRPNYCVLSIVFTISLFLGYNINAQNILENATSLIKNVNDSPVVVSSIEKDLADDGGIENTASRGSRCNSNVGFEVFNDECDKVKIEVSSASYTSSEYRVRYYWRKQGTSNWYRQTYNNVSSRTDYLAYARPGETWELRIYTKPKLSCSYSLRFDNKVLVKKCQQIEFSINDNSSSYCLPLKMTTPTNFGINYSNTTFKLCEVNQQGALIGNCITQSWNSYDASNILSLLNIGTWAQSKGMNLQQNRYYSFEILADPDSYKNHKEVFYIKSWRDCPIDLNSERQRDVQIRND